jgi:triosephosphate isomerase
MRKQIAAANWKMNLTLQQGEKLLDEISAKAKPAKDNHQVVFAVPFPYLAMAQQKIAGKPNVFIAAQNCSNKKMAPIRAKHRLKCCSRCKFNS